MSHATDALKTYNAAKADGVEFLAAGSIVCQNFADHVKPQNSPDRAAENSAAIDARCDEIQWGQVAACLISCRNEMRNVADPDLRGVMRGPQQGVLGRAASSLGPYIAEAVRNQKAAVSRIEAVLLANEPKRERPPGVPSNAEMSAAIHAGDKTATEAIATKGCCGGTPDYAGRCSQMGVGLCPQVKEIATAVTFCERLINESQSSTQGENE